MSISFTMPIITFRRAGCYPTDYTIVLIKGLNFALRSLSIVGDGGKSMGEDGLPFVASHRWKLSQIDAHGYSLLAS
jgi:hypothetical protein